MRYIITFILLLFFVSSAHAQTPIAKGEVVATIAPIHSLVAWVMQGAGEPSLVMHGQQTVHGAALKPSQRRVLHQAQLLFYIDERFERFLQPILAQESAIKAVPLSQSTGLVMKPLRSNHHHEHHEHHEHKHDLHEEGLLEGAAFDYHLWLSPVNVQLMVKHIAFTLGKSYPAWKEQFEKNRSAFEVKLAQREKAWKAQLKSAKETPFVVFHDAYQYLEYYFDLHQAGVVNLAPDMPSSVQHMQHLHHTMQQEQVACIFIEPQFSAEQVQQLAETYHLRMETLDPLGQNLASGATFYFTWMQQQVDALDRCLNQELRTPFASRQHFFYLAGKLL